MGFFSSQCESCQHPLLSAHATNSVNAWMNRAVVITRDGSVLKGTYDGYGSVGPHPDALDDATVWHQACWVKMGSPTDYRGPSTPSPDQGWFFEDPDHDLAEPH